MKSVLISIQPQWCELIAGGKKTVEVRKTKPNIETPFKCYIYQTKLKWMFNLLRKNGLSDLANKLLFGKGKVIGEFVCDGIDEYRYGVYDGEFCYHIPTVEGEKTCLEYPEAEEYGNGKPLYFWHISDLVIYNKPKELSEFYTVDNEAIKQCEHRERVYNNPDYTNGAFLPGSYICNKDEPDWCTKCKTKPIVRPPQSYMYVEEVSK